IDWSWKLLSKDERAAFEALSVFRGGFTPEAAQEVCPCSAHTLEALHRKSLLRVQVAPELPNTLRLTMLESIAAFAAEKLAESPRKAEVRARHAKHYLALAEQWSEDAHGHQAQLALAHLTCERGNLLAVFERGAHQMPASADGVTKALRALHGLDGLVARKGPFVSHLALLDAPLQVAAPMKINSAHS